MERHTLATETSVEGANTAYEEDVQLALALSLSEAEEKAPRQNINPESRSAVAIAKEEERQVQEAIQQSLAEERKPSAVLDRELLPRREARQSPSSPQNHWGSLSPFLRNDINPSDLPELV
mmetsp:Transcript_20850/g.39086  ORF Transcript_20850/g.39086 Transcript_20850/m.39086 type:complete len:121 (-) Transcript_20850:770-1132(-)|eukprot:CAMPEP_0197455596 /NCGR_PEP_ID=MMETSP1175-20131217/41139_1 /TAXON_ID=1003142 /ORGANISM="Triceratium dubium, Strain CCMP147" /LENGTH=120 /DNA_ID=CAMNT_0042989493 /DNA_START=199 /DNA_END=561 /DNA_ORIENTATION=+